MVTRNYVMTKIQLTLTKFVYIYKRGREKGELREFGHECLRLGLPDSIPGRTFSFRQQNQTESETQTVSESMGTLGSFRRDKAAGS
jgi:hypothetical protein